MQDAAEQLMRQKEELRQLELSIKVRGCGFRVFKVILKTKKLKLKTYN